MVGVFLAPSPLGGKGGNNKIFFQEVALSLSKYVGIRIPFPTRYHIHYKENTQTPSSAPPPSQTDRYFLSELRESHPC